MIDYSNVELVDESSNTNLPLPQWADTDEGRHAFERLDELVPIAAEQLDSSTEKPLSKGISAMIGLHMDTLEQLHDDE